jgi:hypothetical protein
MTGRAIAVPLVATLLGLLVFVTPAGAISRGLDHEGFGIELDRVCNIAERQFGGAADLNDFDTDAELYQYLRDIVRVISGFETRLKALKATDPADAKLLKDMMALMARERVFINKMAALAKARKYDQVRTELAAQGDRFTDAEIAISVRLLDSGLPGCSVLATPDETDPTPAPSTTVPAPTVIDPATVQELARFFPTMTGYSYVLYSAEQEKQSLESIANSKILLAVTGRTVIGPDSRVLGDLAVLKTKPGMLTPTFKQDFLTLIAGPRTKVEKLPAVGSFPESYSFTDGEYDEIVVFQGDFIVEFLTRASTNRKASKDFSTLLLTQIDAVAASPTAATTVVPAGPTTTATPTPTTVPTPPATIPAAPTTTASPSAV